MKYIRLEDGTLELNDNGISNLNELLRVSDIVELNLENSPNNMIYLYDEEYLTELKEKHLSLVNAYWFKKEDNTYLRYTE